MIEAINSQKCIGCGLCVEICAMDVLRMQTEVDVTKPDFSKRPVDKKTAYIAYQSDCMTCYTCALKCPTGAIFVNYPPPMNKPQML